MFDEPFAWQIDCINKIKCQILAPLEIVPEPMTSLMVPVPVMSLMEYVPVPVPDLHMMS